MILSTFSDEQVLFELLEDYNSLRNKFKKTALKILKSYSDRGLCVNRNFSKVYKAVSANKNSWTVTLFFDKGNKSKWMMRACCEENYGISVMALMSKLLFSFCKFSANRIQKHK